MNKNLCYNNIFQIFIRIGCLNVDGDDGGFIDP